MNYLRHLEVLRENNTPANVFKFYDKVRRDKPENILENAKYILVEEFQGIQFMTDVIRECKDVLEPESFSKALDDTQFLIESIKTSGIDIPEDLVLFEKELGEIVQEKSSDEWLRVDTISKLSTQIVSENTTFGDDWDIKQKLLFARNQFELCFVDYFMSPVNEDDDYKFHDMMRCAQKFTSLEDEFNAVEEGITKTVSQTVRRTANKVEDGVRGSVHKMRQNRTERMKAGKAIARIPSSFLGLVNGSIEKVKDLDRAERRNKIIEGGFRVKLLRLIRNAIILGAGFAVSPAITAIAMLGAVAADRRADMRVRDRIVEDLEAELKITQEKIKDADRNNNNKAKYELMRIEAKLETEIKRIKYNLGKVIDKRDVYNK